MVNTLLFVLVRTVRKNRIQTKQETDELGDKIELVRHTDASCVKEKNRLVIRPLSVFCRNMGTYFWIKSVCGHTLWHAGS